jgi:triosephosphate isomerase
MRQPMVAGNWKMNGSQASITDLLSGVKQGMSSVSNAEVVMCVPFVYLQQVANEIKDSNVSLGSQNVAKEVAGAFTGEISADMLTDFNCKYAIVGHSERRSLYGETDEIVAEKFIAAQKSNLIPILCVGESLEEREANETENVVARQLNKVLELAGTASFNNAVIAYEPVWAIGTGKTATPEQAQDVHSFIRQSLAAKDAEIASKIRILYGGSMKPTNAVELISKEDIDGGLIGGASLKADDFLGICQAAG